MSLEFALERYPLTGSLKGGVNYVMRPLAKKDGAKLHRFFIEVPEPERLFLRKDVTDRAVVNELCKTIDPEEDLIMLLLVGQKIIGEATLHQHNGGWKRHIGMVTALTHPKFRGLGVVRTLVDELTVLARFLGLKRLEVELNGERLTATRSLEQLGFRTLLKLPEYLQDLHGRSHDYLLMGMELKTDEEYTSAG